MSAATSVEYDVDRAIEVFFVKLEKIAERHGMEPPAVAEIAERRGCGEDGFWNWYEGVGLGAES